jgi:hypothetical protein
MYKRATVVGGLALLCFQLTSGTANAFQALVQAAQGYWYACSPIPGCSGGSNYNVAQRALAPNTVWVIPFQVDLPAGTNVYGAEVLASGRGTSPGIGSGYAYVIVLDYAGNVVNTSSTVTVPANWGVLSMPAVNVPNNGSIMIAVVAGSASPGIILGNGAVWHS